MKLTAAKYLLFAFGVPLLFFIGSTLIVRHKVNERAYEFAETDYRKDYAWDQIEVGTVLRFPYGGVGREAKYYAVVAFRHGDTGQHLLLFKGVSGQYPARPQLMATNGSVVTYSTPETGQTNLDLSGLFPAKAPPKAF